ncbi:MAG TPA: hypothetical protein VIS96_18120 [Terrimicrobiaceae bacterium]
MGVIACLIHGSQALAQTLPATTAVQIVNATSVPAIALRINDRIAYENFPQGLKTADSPASLIKAIYQAEDTRTGSRATSAEITYEAGSNQSLVILGDFSTDVPPGVLRHPGRALTAEEKQYPPNVLFQVFSHAATESPVRLRIINGMPGRNLSVVASGREIFVKPGEFAVLSGQPAIARYVARVDGEKISLLMRQEGLIRNAIVIFYLKSGRPAFMRAFENNAESNRKREELERERE